MFSSAFYKMFQNPANQYMLKVNDINIRTMSEIWSKLAKSKLITLYYSAIIYLFKVNNRNTKKGLKSVQI